MLPLAVSGPTVIAAAIALAILLVWALLRVEARDAAQEQAERGASADDHRPPA